MSRIRLWFRSKSPSQVYSLCALCISIFAVGFFAIIRALGCLWYATDTSAIPDQPFVIREITKAFLLALEFALMYRLLCRTKWWICCVIAVVETAIAYYIPIDTVTQIFYIACYVIIPLSFIILSYCSHNGSNGIIVSHLQAVVPYGKSQRIISIDLSGMCFITSRQSPKYMLFGSIFILLSPPTLTVLL